VAGVFYGTVRIGFSGALNHRTLPPLTRAVRQRYPEVTLEMVGRVMTRDGVAQVERGALDLAFVALPVDPSPLVRTRLVSREPLGVALPIDHPLADAPDVDLADLADDGFITTPPPRDPACRRRRCAPAWTPGSGRGWSRRSPTRT
jgi:DNA-binding transcriptional LysR family regulator